MHRKTVQDTKWGRIYNEMVRNLLRSFNHIQIAYSQYQYQHTMIDYNFIFMLLGIIIVNIYVLDVIPLNLSNFITIAPFKHSQNRSSYHSSSQQRQPLENGFSFVFFAFFLTVFTHIPIGKCVNNQIYFHNYSRYNKNSKWCQYLHYLKYVLQQLKQI